MFGQSLVDIMLSIARQKKVRRKILRCTDAVWSSNYELLITSRDQLSTIHKLYVTSRDQLSTNHKLFPNRWGRYKTLVVSFLFYILGSASFLLLMWTMICNSSNDTDKLKSFCKYYNHVVQGEKGEYAMQWVIKWSWLIN